MMALIGINLPLEEVPRKFPRNLRRAALCVVNQSGGVLLECCFVDQRLACRRRRIGCHLVSSPSAAVAVQLTANDALSAHARDELGISAQMSAKPIQAAFTSAATFTVGAALPLLSVLAAPAGSTIAVVSGASLAFLGFLGAVAAKTGGASVFKPTVRVMFWGALAMAVTALIGNAFGATV